jgi:hypothetical protein
LRYQVVGMRPGPDAGTTVFADAGPVASATVEPAPTTPAGTDSSGSGGSGADDGSAARTGSGVPTGNGVTSVHREFAVPGQVAGTPTTVDTGYNERLPFKPRAGDEAVGTPLGADDSGSRGSDDARQRALLVGGAAVVFAWAMLLRFLSRRALVY